MANSFRAMISNNIPHEDSARKSEELYKLSRDAYASAEKRFDDAEAKIGRYLSILFVVLGLATISVDRLRAVILTTETPNILFAVLTLGFYLCGLIAFACFVQALRVQQVRTLKLDDSVSRYFEKYTLSAGLGGLAKAFFGAAERFRERTQEKLRLAHRGFVFLLASIVFAVLAACAYLFVDPLEDKEMSIQTNAGGDDSTEQSSPDPGNEPSNDPTQAAEDAAQLFEDMQKSFEGGENREEK
jgi:hypothetical protein